MRADAERALLELQLMQTPPRRPRKPHPWTLDDLLARYVAGRLGVGF